MTPLVLKPIYKAFLSYAHAADGRLVPAVQSGLHRFAKRGISGAR